MSISIDLLVAREDEAQAVCADRSPLEHWDGFDASGQDEVTLGNLFSIARGQYAGRNTLLDCETLAEASEAGPWVLRLPHEFQTAIAALEMQRVRLVAQRWMGTDKLENHTEREALRFIQEVKKLVLRARATRSEVLMRVSI